MTYKEQLQILDTLDKHQKDGFYLWQAIIANEIRFFTQQNKLSDEEFERYCDIAYDTYMECECCPVEAVVSSTIAVKASSKQSVLNFMEEHFLWGTNN